MAAEKVLIKFISPHHTGNVLSSLALEPELLVLVGYGDFLTESVRNRYNHFFHIRNVETVLTDPVRIDPVREDDIEVRLEQMLERYAAERPSIDITDADPKQALILGTILAAHPSWHVSVFSYNLAEATFSSVRDGEHVKRLTFPSIDESDISFLRRGTTKSDPRIEGRAKMTRSDLTKPVIMMIRALSEAYRDRPAFWRSFAEKLQTTPIGLAGGKREYLLDASDVGIRDDAFEELADRGVITRYVRRNGILDIEFCDGYASYLAANMDKIPSLNLFIETALIRDYRQKAAYRDLSLVDYRYVTGIRGCLPYVIGVYNEGFGAEDICDFKSFADQIFGDPVRMILVKDTGLPIPATVMDAATSLKVEIVDAAKLTMLLTPR